MGILNVILDPICIINGRIQPNVLVKKLSHDRHCNPVSN